MHTYYVSLMETTEKIYNISSIFKVELLRISYSHLLYNIILEIVYRNVEDF